MKILAFAVMVLLCIVIAKNFVIFLLCGYMKKKGITNENVQADTQKQANRLKMMLRNCLSGFIILNLKRVGKLPSNNLRTLLLKYIYHMKIGKSVLIHSDFTIRHPWNISIDDGSVIGDYCYLDGRKGIKIGKNVNISTGVCIWTMEHDVNDPYFRVNQKFGQVV